MIKVLAFDQFADMYCERQVQEPRVLKGVLQSQYEQYHPDGWMLLECAVLDSSHLGSYTILPYGPHNTHKGIPFHPVSPRGLASDMSVVVAVLPASVFIGVQTVKDLRGWEAYLNDPTA